MALFSLLGTFGPLLRVSWLLVGFLGRFDFFQERSGLEFGGFGTLPVRFFGTSDFYFSSVFSACGLAFRTSSRYAKTMEKPRFFRCFMHMARVASKNKTTENRS